MTENIAMPGHLPAAAHHHERAPGVGAHLLAADEFRGDLVCHEARPRVEIFEARRTQQQARGFELELPEVDGHHAAQDNSADLQRAEGVRRERKGRNGARCWPARRSARARPVR
jgi:hypothetical protein